MVVEAMRRQSSRALLLVALLVPAVQAYATPRVQSWITPQGAKVMYVQAPDLPMIDVRVVFDAGSARDGALPGLGGFVNALLTEGAGPWDADQLAQRLEERGIDIGTGAMRDMAWASIRSLTDKKTLDVALSTLREVVSAPRFEAAAVERIRQQLQIALRQTEQSPGGIASKLFYEAVYGAHPYAHLSTGTPEAILMIGADDLRRFHRQYYVARNAVVAIVGAVDSAQAEAIAGQVVGALPSGEAAPKLAAPQPVKAAELRENYDSQQTHIRIGQPGMSRHDPDYFPLYVGNHAFGGGGLVSILGEEVRNKRGLSYSVYSYFQPMQAAGPFLMAAQTKNSQAAEAIEVMRQTLRDFIAKGPSQEELTEAKQNLTGGFPMTIASNRKIVEYIAMMGFYDYPLDWLDTLVAKMDAVTVEQVRDAFARRVDPDALVAVIVGGTAEAAAAAPAAATTAR